jgi:hypothetical protein
VRVAAISTTPSTKRARIAASTTNRGTRATNTRIPTSPALPRGLHVSVNSILGGIGITCDQFPPEVFVSPQFCRGVFGSNRVSGIEVTRLRMTTKTKCYCIVKSIGAAISLLNDVMHIDGSTSKLVANAATAS